MLKWISLVLVIVGVILYFTGALEIENNADSVDISIDKDKTKELKDKIKDKLEE
jgi:hypothetical protein